MKKLICFLLVVISAVSLTACASDGCGKKYDIAKNANLIKENGFEIEEELRTPDDLIEKNKLIDEKFAEYEVELDLKLTEYTSLVKDRPETPATDDGFACVFMRFENPSQALTIYNTMMKAGKDPELGLDVVGYKVLRAKNVVVMTNSPVCEELLGGRFK